MKYVHFVNREPFLNDDPTCISTYCEKFLTCYSQRHDISHHRKSVEDINRWSNKW
jgi:hypothetical protein